MSLQIPKQEKFIAEDIPLDIIFEDDDIIIINKVAGMVTHPAPGNQNGTLVHALLNHTSDKLSSINKNNRPGIVHRLDKDTSGLIIIAKDNRKKMTLNQNKRGKFSQTTITLKKNFGICSIVECLLKTGRTHQVRLHMTSINNPIVGDKLYGKNKINKFGKNKETFNKFHILKNFKRQALHAYHIGFTLPFTKKYLEFESEFPQDLKNLLDLLVKY